MCTAKIVNTVPQIDSKYYAATQVIDEARHVEVYSRYLHDKLELTYPINPNLRQLLIHGLRTAGGTSPTSPCKPSSRASPWPPSG